MLYEVAVVQTRTKKEAEEGTGGEKLILPPTAQLAPNENVAAMIACKGLDMSALDPNRLQILIRPFVQGQQ
jgi:hypothetical protein